jgi:hypothetical protein
MKKMIQGVFTTLALFLITTSGVSAATVSYVWTEEGGGSSTGTLTLSGASVPLPPTSWGPLNVTIDTLIFNGNSYTPAVGVGISSDGSGLTGGFINVNAGTGDFRLRLEAGADYVAITNVGTYLGDWTVATVPIPAAVWLFGSGLLALVGFARKKKAI